MVGHSLNLTSQLQCPHGGNVTLSSTNIRVSGGNAKLVTSSDQFTITGCPFQLPTTPPIPSPCVRVQWLVADMRVRVNAGFTLSQSSVGLCLSATQIPQGTVIVKQTQSDVSSQ